MSKKILLILFVVCLLAFILIASGPFPQEIETKDGVRIIHNKEKGIWSDQPRLFLELVRTVGGLDVEDEHQIFSSPKAMALDDESCLYVLDMREAHIRKFSQDNEFLTEIGGRGQGPGELMHVSGFDLDEQGRLCVNGQLKCKIFSPQGKELKYINLPRYTLNGDIRVLKSGDIAVGGWIQNTWPGQEFKDTHLIKIFDLEGNLQKKIGEIYDYGKPLLNSHGNRFRFDVDQSGHFVVSFIYQNRIEKYSKKGELIWKADRVLPYSTKPISEGFMTSDERGRGIQAPNMNWVSFGVASDGKKRTWVITVADEMNHKNMEESRYNPDWYKLEVFDPEGVLLQEISLDHACHSIRAHGNQLLLLDLNETKVYQYEVFEEEKVLN
ncbi:MAG: 6-bladed beta-propeller [Candidatus Aminicenantes bacterium]